MIRKAYIIGILALGLTAGAVHTSPMVGKVVSSAESFRYYFRDLKQSGTAMSPIERFVFSLVMANSKAPQAPNQTPAQISIPESTT